MNLRADVNLSDFFRAVHACQNEVLFETPEGDRFDLKSILSQFVFTAAMAGPLRESGGHLTYNKADEPLLAPFLAR